MVDNDCEFPTISKGFNSFKVSPVPMEVHGRTWKTELILRNHGDTAVLFKVKCTSNKRIHIADCADILFPGNETNVMLHKVQESEEKDQLLILYCLVGKQWSDEEASALNAWKRVKSREVPTRSIIVPITEK